MDESKKNIWSDWKTWGTVLGVISTALLLLEKVGGCLGTAEQIVKLPERVTTVEDRVEDSEKYQFIDSVATAGLQTDQAEVSKILNDFDAQMDAIMINITRIMTEMGLEAEGVAISTDK